MYLDHSFQAISWPCRTEYDHFITAWCRLLFYHVTKIPQPLIYITCPPPRHSRIRSMDAGMGRLDWPVQRDQCWSRYSRELKMVTKSRCVGYLVLGFGIGAGH